ncbi:MAG: YkgJ family cysteine cluster protein [Candidatus Thorarchaeota archaeon]
MKDEKSLRFECTRCGNCCTDKNTIVNLTYLDILRIKAGLKLDLNEILNILGFYVFEKDLTSDDKKRMSISPVITEKGLAFIGLLKSSIGNCFFYDSKNKKCRIYELRPLFCKTFPFSFKYNVENQTNKKIDIIYTEKGKEYCPGISNEAPLINYDEWIELGKKILEDLEKNYILIKEWNKSVKNNKVSPKVKNFILNIFKLNKN